MQRLEGLAAIERSKIIAIARGITEEQALKCAEAILSGGLSVMEITLNTHQADKLIRSLQNEFGHQMFIGAGTVLDTEDLKRAVDAGAAYIVTPNTDPAVIQEAVRLDLPIFPGAYTPTEVVTAWKAGATAVKLFPSASVGIGYVKELQGPLGHIPMIPTGGIRPDNLKEYLELGCYAFGVGTQLLAKDAITSGDYSAIQQRAEAFSSVIRAYSASIT